MSSRQTVAPQIGAAIAFGVHPDGVADTRTGVGGSTSHWRWFSGLMSTIQGGPVPP